MNASTPQQTDASAIALDRPPVRVRRINAAAALPEYKTSHAAGMDLAACLPDGDITIPPGEIRMIPCGFAMALPDGYEAQVRPRSGLASRHAITLPNAPGTIDADYRGEVMVPLINHGKADFTVAHHDRIAQMIIAPVARAELTLVDDLDDTERGSGGFGSTGV